MDLRTRATTQAAVRRCRSRSRSDRRRRRGREEVRPLERTHETLATVLALWIGLRGMATAMITIARLALKTWPVERCASSVAWFGAREVPGSGRVVLHSRTGHGTDGAGRVVVILALTAALARLALGIPGAKEVVLVWSCVQAGVHGEC